MPTKFETAFMPAAALLLDVFGQEVSYILDGADPVTITGDWKPDQELISYMATEEQDFDVGVLSISPADIALPTVRDVVTIEGQDYAVVSIQKGQGLHDLQLEARTQIKMKRNARTVER